MDHANLRRKYRPEDYHLPLPSFGPVYQIDRSRADGAVRNSYSYARSACVAPYESQASLRLGAKNTFTPEEARNVSPTSQRRVSQPFRLSALEQSR